MDAEIKQIIAQLSGLDSDTRANKLRVELTTELTAGTPAYRDAAAEVAVQIAGPIARGEGFSANMMVLLLYDLEHPAALPALLGCLSSPDAAIRYRAARGIRLLQGKLITPEQYRPVITELANAAETETAEIVVTAIFEAMDFKLAVPDFSGSQELANELTRVFTVHARDLENRGHDVANDHAGFLAAFRLAGDLKTPPTALVANLAAALKELTGRYLDDPTSVRRHVVADCEAALRVHVEKHGTSLSGVPLISEMMATGAGRDEIEAALAKYIGAGETPGALNAAPWNQVIGLGG